MPLRTPQLVVIHSQNGGVGKTVGAGGLSAGLATLLGGRLGDTTVVMAEANAVRSTLRWSLAAYAESDWCTAMCRGHDTDRALVALEPAELGVRLLPGPALPDQWLQVPAEVLSEAMSRVQQQYPLVVVDTGQHVLNPVHAAALAHADVIVAVTSLFAPRVQALGDWWLGLEYFLRKRSRKNERTLAVLGLERKWDGREARRRLARVLPRGVQTFSMAPIDWQDTYDRPCLPPLDGRFGEDMLALARFILGDGGTRARG